MGGWGKRTKKQKQKYQYAAQRTVLSILTVIYKFVRWREQNGGVAYTHSLEFILLVSIAV